MHAEPSGFFGTQTAVGEYNSVASVPQYAEAFTDLGPTIRTLTTFWSDARPIDIGDSYAIFGVVQTIGGQQRLHYITFTYEEGRWLISGF